MIGLRLLLFALAFVAIFGAIATYAVGGRRRRAGFTVGPTGTVRVVDTDTDGSATLILRDPQLGLCGKPDYLLATTVDGRDLLLPMEVKPTRRSTRLYESDRIQLGAYLLALRGSVPDRAASIGYVQYADRTFDVVLTPSLAAEIARLVAAVRRGRSAAVMHRSHTSPAKCRACPVRAHCDEALG